MKPSTTVDKVVALVAGLLFALGLGIAGMTHPRKVTGFLDVFGDWDPTLLFVMGAAILFHAPVALMMRARQSRAAQNAGPDGCGVLPSRSDSAAWRHGKLIGGATVFGVGWGTSGFCPGPALVSLGGASQTALVFTLGMIIAMAVHARWAR